MNPTEKKDKPKSRRRVLPILLALVVLVLGLSLLLYPTVADYVNSLGYKRVIRQYEEEVQALDDTERNAMLAEAYAWNAALYAESPKLRALRDEQREEYNRILNPFGNGVIGYIEIESIHIYLPIYHGTGENVLHSGIGHLEGSSLPVGGAGTHALLSGHSGLPSSKLFTNIDRLEAGDTFVLHILGEELTYRVESKVKVLPEEAEKLLIEEDKDICTLMTCTPYGVNTHRLLVRGIRVD